MDGGSIDALRDDIKKNLGREVKFRVQGRNKQAVMDALVSVAELDLPKGTAEAEAWVCLLERVGAELEQRGIKDAARLKSLKTSSCLCRASRAPGSGGGRAGQDQQPANHRRTDPRLM